jgi:16S rRNA processing protein RimM
MERSTPTPDTPPADTLVRIGHIFRPHGVRGELKVEPETDDPTLFERLDTVYVGSFPDRTVPHAIESARYQESKRGLTIILKLEDVDGRDAAELLKKKFTFVPEDELPELEEGEFFIHDLIGLNVVAEDGSAIGTVANVMQMPAHDVYVVRRDGKPEAMIPAVEDFIIEIDLDGGRVVVRPIDGLLE